MTCPEIPAFFERSQGDWVASFLFLLELVGISPIIQIREIREIREITAAVSKKTCLSLHNNVNFHQINVLFHFKSVFCALSKLEN